MSLIINLNELQAQHNITVYQTRDKDDQESLVFDFDGEYTDRGWNHMDVAAFADAWDYNDNELIELDTAISTIHTRIMIGKALQTAASWKEMPPKTKNKPLRKGKLGTKSGGYQLSEKEKHELQSQEAVSDDAL
jgi:hypothetical protein